MRLMLMLFVVNGCDESCPEASRLDGGWAVYSEVDLASASGTNAGSFPWEDVFVQGWSEWDLAFVAGRQEFELSLDGQPFKAAYTPDEVDCDAFTLAFDGRYLGEDGSTHDFTWSGELVRAGTHFDGDFSFEDTWADPTAGEQGTLSVQGGTVTANAREGG